MRQEVAVLAAFGLQVAAAPAIGATFYSNLTPNSLMKIAPRPQSAGAFEIEAGDNFVLSSQSIINLASFVGLLVSGSGGTPTILEIVAEMYRGFPLDSNTAGMHDTTARVNSPSDVAFDSLASAAGQLTFTTSVLSGTFKALNSAQPMSGSG